MVPSLPLDELSTVFARLSGMLLTQEKVDPALTSLAGAIKAAVPGAVGAGVTLIDAEGHRTSTGYTDEVVAEADALQYSLNHGPCLTAWAKRTTVRMDDVSADPRWPLWSSAVASMPIRSVLSSPLLYGSGALGALKVYASTPHAFPASSQAMLELTALPAATLLANAQGSDAPQRLSAGLTNALTSRDAINAASGVLMERHGLRKEEALRELLQLAETQSSTVRDTALRVLGSTAAGGRTPHGL
ncbi:MAG: histidine kinase [Micrococcaceae bacterium]|nr:histidine kinase [Micrococcaceae bacterium]